MAVVFAADAADARAMASSKYGQDGDPQWVNSTVTQVAADADLENWRMRCQVAAPAGEANVADVTVVGLASADMDDLGALLQTALNATASIAGALYTSATQVLIVAVGSGGDDLGDHTVVLELLPPAAEHTGAVAVPGGVVSITHEGVSTADLTATLAADAYVVPNLVAVGKRES